MLALIYQHQPDPSWVSTLISPVHLCVDRLAIVAAASLASEAALDVDTSGSSDFAMKQVAN
jgi:hypothetical protein